MLCLRFFGNTCRLVIYQNPATVFAGNDLLALADLQLDLRWDLVETTTTRIPLYRYYGQTVAVRSTDLIVRFD
jgi:hypothetical protein